MGVVYRAHQISINRRVALKVIAPELVSDGSFRRRFERESRVAVELEHPNIVPVYWAGEADGLLFIAMRYIEGSDLRRIISSETPLAPHRVASLLAQIASGLDAAHSKGLVHRDVKPANVMVERLAGGREHCYVMDFGLARRDESTRLTRTDKWLGTIDYVAPEQITGGHIDARTDVYSLGVLLFLALTGELPFSREHDAGTLFAHLNSPAPRAREVRPELPQTLDAVIARALAKDPAARFASAGDFARAAASALTGAAQPEETVAELGVAVGSALSGTVTLLFTDIEGSTALWESHPEEMRLALERHDELLRGAIESFGGHVFKTVGDAFCATFGAAERALAAAVAGQRAIAAEHWPEPLSLRVRMGVHSGVCSERDGDYFGPTVNRTARLQAIAHGGQLLLSAAAHELAEDRLPAGVALREMGEHRLKDLERPELVFQVDIEGLAGDFPPLRSLSGGLVRHNLPVQVSSFIGRERELAQLRGLLEDSRLVTIVGAGGSGKTRLALQLAAELLDGSGDGVWFVDLAPLADEDLVAATVASVLGVREEPGRPMLETLATELGERDLLVVLDNCEHVIDAAATLAGRLLASCGQVELLATSREPLSISAEQVYRVPSLAVPDEQASDPDAVAGSEAVLLFMERAAKQKPDLTLDADNAATIARICRRLDGIPLALELAAARLRSLSPSDLDARLDDCFRVLKSTSRDALPRQQTLKALIDWSWNLLSEPEGSVLSRLSVFAASFDLDAAEAVTNDDEPDQLDVYDLLASLVDKSLVQADDTEDSTRYRLLETVRQYAAAKLIESGRHQTARGAHLRYYLTLAETAKPHLHSHDAKTWMDRLDRERDNLRVALTASLSHADPTLGLRLVVALARFWGGMRGYAAEVVDATSALLDRSDSQEPTLLRAIALNAVAQLATGWLGDHPLGRRSGEESLAIARSLGDEEAICEALWSLAWIDIQSGEARAALALLEEAFAFKRPLENQELLARLLVSRAGVFADLGDSEAAREDYERAMRIYEELGDSASIGATDGALASLALERRDLPTARSHLERAFSRGRDTGDANGLLSSTLNLGVLEYLEGNAARARSSFTESLATARRHRDQTAVGYSLFGLALTETALGDHSRSARLHGAGAAGLERLGHVCQGIEAELRDVDHRRLRAIMGDEAFEQAYQQGRRMPLPEAIALAQSDRQRELPAQRNPAPVKSTDPAGDRAEGT
jgi:predicted ATPase/class 3 adenylate cyclase